jgi:hypothetical protein
MFKLNWFVVLFWVLIAVRPSFADDHTKILGIWKLVSYEAEFQATGEREPTLGKNPIGYIIFTPEGRFMAVLTRDGLKAPTTDQDRADLLKSIFAFTGMYRFEGDKWITKVDVSCNPAWVGTEQVRYFQLDGDRLQVTSAWVQSVTRPERGMARAILTYERVK